MSQPLYPALRAVLGDKYADLAAVPPDTLSLIEFELDYAYDRIDDLLLDIETLENELVELEDRL